MCSNLKQHICVHSRFSFNKHCINVTMSGLSLHKLQKRQKLNESAKVRKINRFDGVSEEEVEKSTLPDHLDMNLDIVFIGINPGLMSAHRKRYYAGPGNHFYKLLHASGLVPYFINFEYDYKLLEHGIGLTNIVARATKSSADLTKAEIKEGAAIIEQKIKHFRPKVAVFNGKCIYEVFSGKAGKQLNFGLQPEFIDNTAVWVVPSSSARCSNFPRMNDKLHFYTALKKYVEYIKGELTNVNISDFVFENKCKTVNEIRDTQRKICLKDKQEMIISKDKESEDKNDDNKKQVKRDNKEDNVKNLNEDIKEYGDVRMKSSFKRKESSTDYVNLIKQRISEKHNLNDITIDKANSKTALK